MDEKEEFVFSDINEFFSEFLNSFEEGGWKIKRKWISKKRPYKFKVTGSGNLAKVANDTDFYSFQKKGEKEYRIRFKIAAADNRSIVFGGTAYVFDLKGNTIKKIDNVVDNEEYLIATEKSIAKLIALEAEQSENMTEEAIELVRKTIEKNQYLIKCNDCWYSLHYYKDYWALHNATFSGRVPVYNALLEVHNGKYVSMPKEITEIDKLNGIVWNGEISYQIEAMRFCRLDKKNWQKGRPEWSKWFDPKEGSLITAGEAMRDKKYKYDLFRYTVQKKENRWQYKMIEGVQNSLTCDYVRNFVTFSSVTEKENLLEQIQSKRKALSHRPTYHYETSSITGTISTIWTTITAKILAQNLAETYDKFYYAALDYQGMSNKSLNTARDLVIDGKFNEAKEFIRKSDFYHSLSNKCEQAAYEVYKGNLEASVKIAEGIYKGSMASVKIGAKLVDPSGGKIFDALFLAGDTAIAYSEGGTKKALKTAGSKAITMAIFRYAKFERFGNKTLEQIFEAKNVARGTIPIRVDEVFMELSKNPGMLNQAIETAAPELAAASGEHWTKGMIEEVSKVMITAIGNGGTTSPNELSVSLTGRWNGTFGSDGIREVVILTQAEGIMNGTSFFENQQGVNLSQKRGVVNGTISGYNVRFTLSRDGMVFSWIGSVNSSYTVLKGGFEGYSNVAVYTKQ
jgi:hypothetical protein